MSQIHGRWAPLKSFKLMNQIKPNKTDFPHVRIYFKRQNKTDD